MEGRGTLNVSFPGTEDGYGAAYSYYIQVRHLLGSEGMREGVWNQLKSPAMAHWAWFVEWRRFRYRASPSSGYGKPRKNDSKGAPRKLCDRCLKDHRLNWVPELVLGSCQNCKTANAPDGEDFCLLCLHVCAFASKTNSDMAEMLDTTRISREARGDVDDAGDPWLDDDDEPREPVEFEPLPPGAGIPETMPRGHRPPPPPEPTAFALQIRAFLDQQ